jgi:hypothetical protein
MELLPDTVLLNHHWRIGTMVIRFEVSLFFLWNQYTSISLIVSSQLFHLAMPQSNDNPTLCATNLNNTPCRGKDTRVVALTISIRVYDIIFPLHKMLTTLFNMSSIMSTQTIDVNTWYDCSIYKVYRIRLVMSHMFGYVEQWNISSFGSSGRARTCDLCLGSRHWAKRSGPPALGPKINTLCPTLWYNVHNASLWPWSLLLTLNVICMP